MRRDREGHEAGRSGPGEPQRPPPHRHELPPPEPPPLSRLTPASRARTRRRARPWGRSPGVTGKRRRTCVRACVRARSRWRRRIGEARVGDPAGIGPRAGAVRAAPSGFWGRGRSRGGRDWSGARAQGGGSQGLGFGGVEPHFVAAGVPGLRPQCRRHHGLPVGQAHGPRRQNGERAGRRAAGSRGKMATAGRAGKGLNWGPGTRARLGEDGGLKTCEAAEVRSRELRGEESSLPSESGKTCRKLGRHQSREKG